MAAARSRFDQRADQVVRAIETRMHNHEEILRGGVGLYAASKEVDRDEWRSYVATLKLEQAHPGVQAMGVSYYVPLAKRDAHVAEIRKELPTYSLKPEGERSEYHPVVFIEPFYGRNLMAVGFDLYSEPNRRAALDRARDTGRAALTARVTLVQEDGQSAQPGFLMYLPIYANGRPIGTVDERRAALFGFVGSPFRMYDLMYGILGTAFSDIDLEVYDGTTTDKSALLYDDDGVLRQQLPERPIFSRTDSMDIAGRTWTLVFASKPRFESAIDHSKALLVLLGGMALSAMVFATMRSLTHARSTAVHLAEQMTERLRESEERYMLAIRGSNDGVWDWKIASNEVYFSPRWKEQIGYRDDEIPNLMVEFDSRVHPEDFPKVHAATEAHLSSGVPFCTEFRFRAKDGSYRWIRSRGEAVRDADGHPVRMAGSHVDITETKLALQGIEQINAELEARVGERTRELAAANAELQREIAERRRAEDDLKRANENLELTIAKMEQHTSDITVLGELGDLLRACKTAEEAFDIIARYGASMFETESGGLFMIKPSRNLVDVATHWGNLPAEDMVFMPDDCWALRRGKLNLEAAGQGGLHCRHVSGAVGHSSLCIPLIAQGEAMGILHLRGRGPGQRGLEDSMQLAEAVAEHIGLALASLKLRDTLRSQSIRDPLTGLFNRRYMEETLQREERRAARANGSIGVIMFDIDHFKELNDSFGHAAGDDVLRALAHMVQRQTRDGDIVCRYGGEEFTVILPGASLETSLERAEVLRAAMEQLSVEYLGQELPRLTISLGVAAFPQHGVSCDDVLGSADRALYKAKQHGRNRVVRAD